MNLKLTLEYDGTGFHGWARQPALRTVEGTLREALAAVFLQWDELAVAGRTDTGVHATGQVASVRVAGGPPLDRAADALNAVLPDDVVVLASEDAADDFHARFSAVSRSYRYRVRTTRSALEARRSLWWPRPLDLGALRAAATALVGEHDFRAFTPTETQHEVFVREVAAAEGCVLVDGEDAKRPHSDQKIVELLKPLESLGPRAHPTPMLLEMAKSGKKFYDL